VAVDSFKNLRSIWFIAKVHLILSRLDQQIRTDQVLLDPGDRRRLREGGGEPGTLLPLASAGWSAGIGFREPRGCASARVRSYPLVHRKE
jgi:hypothetical protein